MGIEELERALKEIRTVVESGGKYLDEEIFKFRLAYLRYEESIKKFPEDKGIAERAKLLNERFWRERTV